MNAMLMVECNQSLITEDLYKCICEHIYTVPKDRKDRVMTLKTSGILIQYII